MTTQGTFVLFFDWFYYHINFFGSFRSVSLVSRSVFFIPNRFTASSYTFPERLLRYPDLSFFSLLQGGGVFKITS